MTSMSRRFRISVLLAALALVFSSVPSRAQDFNFNPGGRVGFNPQPDPPGFGLIPVDAGQTVRLNVVCFEHQVGHFPPGPCRGELMFHDAAGNVLSRGSYDLQPGRVAALQFTPKRDKKGDKVGDVATIVPCVLPAPGGRAIPSVEVVDRLTGHTTLFANPAATRMTDFNNGRPSPGSLVGFNPQPDPPGFGAVTVAMDQVVRLNVACFDHQVGGIPPDPCRGTVMFHDAQGADLARGSYSLQPGKTAVLDLDADAAVLDLDAGATVTLTPCILPAPGGRAVPNVQVIDALTGQTSLLINPAATQMSDFVR